jgi:DNA-binding NarL/FixJ family response regulator
MNAGVGKGVVMSRLDSSITRQNSLKLKKIHSVLWAQKTEVMPVDHRPTVVLADDHHRILEKVSEILSAECCILAAVSDGSRSVEAVEKLMPDVVILDIAMPGVGGIQAAREIVRRGMKCRIIFLTVQEDAEYVQVASEIGAGYVLKSRMHTDLPHAVREALLGRPFVSRFSVIGTTR